MKNIKITFKTITPLWTGDAWGDNKGIRPSSIIGSLRFWFEVICYFAGITNESNYKDGKLKDDINEKDFKAKLQSNGTDFSGIDETLAEMEVSLPSRIFGCTGWKGWVRIKEIRPIDDYCFGNKLNLPYKICVSKRNQEIKENRDCPNFSNDDYSVWYFAQPYFYGKFKVIFEVEEKILKPIFYPLLTFMEKYGLWGGKWNIGYGRLKVEKVEINKSNNFEEVANCQKEEFGFSKFFKNEEMNHEDKKFEEFIQNANNFSELENKTNKILYKLKNQITDNDFKNIIKELIKTKATERKNHKNNFNDNELRHLLFGTTKYPPRKEDLPQGTKIIPWVYEENNRLKGGFISIAGILNLR